MINTISVTAKTLRSSAYILLSSKYLVSLLFIILVNSFDIVDSKLIPRYCSGVRGSVIELFGIGLIIACRHIFGVNPVCKILLN